MKFVFLGAPGAGKGTQASLIADKFGIAHISTGDIFRENIKNETELGLKVKSLMDEGKLCPDDLTVELVKDRISQEDCKKGFILDGFPRTIAQAEVFETVLNNANEKLDAVIDIDIPDQAVIDRMSGRRLCKECGESYHVMFNPTKEDGICDKCSGELYIRKDDEEATVLNRLVEYHKNTEPLIDFYNDRGLLKKVDGSVDIDDVTANIEDIVTKFA